MLVLALLSICGGDCSQALFTHPVSKDPTLGVPWASIPCYRSGPLRMLSVSAFLRSPNLPETQVKTLPPGSPPHQPLAEWIGSFPCAPSRARLLRWSTDPAPLYSCPPGVGNFLRTSTFSIFLHPQASQQTNDQNA